MLLAHKNDLKNDEWKVLPHLKDWSLNNVNGEYRLYSNICPHQGSYFKGTEGKNTRLCPYHGWSFKTSGEPIGSGSTDHWCKNEETLESKEVFEWNGYLFSEGHDLPTIDYIQSDHLVLEEMRVDRVHANYIDIVNIFLDMDHLPVVHPKIYDQLSVEAVEWQILENSSVQYAPNNKDKLNNEFGQTMLQEDRDRKHGAAWFCVYPYTMLEYFPGAWFNTVCNPIDDKETAVTVYKYRDTRYSEKNWELNCQIWETAWGQDKEQSQSVVPHFKSRFLEKQKTHYLNWINKKNHPDYFLKWLEQEDAQY